MNRLADLESPAEIRMPLPRKGRAMNIAPKYQVRMYSPIRGSVWVSAPRRLKIGVMLRYPPTDIIAATPIVRAKPCVTSLAASS